MVVVLLACCCHSSWGLSSVTSVYHDSLGRSRSQSQSSSTGGVGSHLHQEKSSNHVDAETAPLNMNTPARQSLPDHLKLVPMQGKGLGVVTTVPIPQNTVVGDYAGEILTAQEKDRRYLASQEHLQTPVDRAWIKSRIDRGQTVTGTYVYGISLPKSAECIYIDSEDEDCSLWTRFINHAEKANLSPKSIHETYNGQPRVWFVTNQDIEANTELSFDYGDDYWLPGDNVVA